MSKERIASQYKFLVVLENQVMEDYVTEKFYEGLKTGALMVYLGAPNAEHYAPAALAMVNALRFPTPAALADHLVHLDANLTAYDEYTAWRRAGPAAVLPSFATLAERGFASQGRRAWQCRLCQTYATRFCATHTY